MTGCASRKNATGEEEDIRGRGKDNGIMQFRKRAAKKG